MRDQDNAPCHLVKERLRELCREGRRSDALIRIVCRELESWFLGELRAVATAMDAPRVAELRAKEMFRDPDRLGTPSAKLADSSQAMGKSAVRDGSAQSSIPIVACLKASGSSARAGSSCEPAAWLNRTAPVSAGRSIQAESPSGARYATPRPRRREGQRRTGVMRERWLRLAPGRGTVDG